MPKKNVGGADKMIRIVLGLIIIAVGVYFGSWWGLLGIIVLLTGVLSRCGLYYLVGMNTCPVDTAAPTNTPPVAPPQQ